MHANLTRKRRLLGGGAALEAGGLVGGVLRASPVLALIGGSPLPLGLSKRIPHP
jgi:hypothetical protein